MYLPDTQKRNSVSDQRQQKKTKQKQTGLQQPRGRSWTDHQPLEGRADSHSHIISSPPGLHVGGLWVENRRPGEEPTQDAGEHVNFTQNGSRLICEPWTRSADRVYLLLLVKAIRFHCARHSRLPCSCLLAAHRSQLAGADDDLSPVVTGRHGVTGGQPTTVANLPHCRKKKKKVLKRFRSSTNVRDTSFVMTSVCAAMTTRWSRADIYIFIAVDSIFLKRTAEAAVGATASRAGCWQGPEICTSAISGQASFAQTVKTSPACFHRPRAGAQPHSWGR